MLKIFALFQQAWLPMKLSLSYIRSKKVKKSLHSLHWPRVKYSNISDLAKSYRALDGSTEAILSKKPTHIIFASFNKKTYLDLFSKLKIHTIRL